MIVYYPSYGQVGEFTSSWLLRRFGLQRERLQAYCTQYCMFRSTREICREEPSGAHLLAPRSIVRQRIRALLRCGVGIAAFKFAHVDFGNFWIRRIHIKICIHTQVRLLRSKLVIHGYEISTINNSYCISRASICLHSVYFPSNATCTFACTPNNNVRDISRLSMLYPQVVLLNV